MFNWKTILAIVLGQILSLCATGSSFATAALWKYHSLNVPFTQNFCCYFLMAIIYTCIAKKRPQTNISWKMIGYSFADVHANVLLVMSLKVTSLLSVLVLSSSVTPCAMIFSAYFLDARYNKIHIQSTIVCLFGLGILIWSDTTDNADESAVAHGWIGDILCLLSSTLYAASCVTEEHLVSHYTSSEFIKYAGILGSLFSGIQAFYFEFDQVKQIEWSFSVLLFFAIYILCIVCIYSITPTFCRMFGATFYSMSLITSNFYSLFLGLLYLDSKIPKYYPIAYALVIISVIAYCLAPSPVYTNEQKHDLETRPILHDKQQDHYL